jgi:hypothetical protein
MRYARKLLLLLSRGARAALVFTGVIGDTNDDILADSNGDVIGAMEK